MLLPDELAPEFYQFDVLPVQLTHDLGALVIVEEGELLRDVHLVHDGVPSTCPDMRHQPGSSSQIKNLPPSQPISLGPGSNALA